MAQQIEHEFVEFIPREMEENTLYVAMGFATASHRCFCGCGSEVVTPLSPVGWQLFFDGEAVSLTPSIGSWSLPCQSHYWIRRGEIDWASPMSPEEIDRVKRRDRWDAERHYGAARQAPGAPPQVLETKQAKPQSFWSRVKKLWS